MISINSSSLQGLLMPIFVSGCKKSHIKPMKFFMGHGGSMLMLSSLHYCTSTSYMGLRGTGGPRQSLLVLPQAQLSVWDPFGPPSWKILHPAVQNVHQPNNQHHW